MVPRSSVGPRSFGFRSLLSRTSATLAACTAMLVTAGAQAQQPTEPAAGGQPRPATGATSAAPEPESGEAAHDDLIPQGAGPNDGTPHVDPSTDQQKLVQQGRERPTADGSVGARPSEVYSEDWWAHTRPIVEVHGYFRTRGELFHNFALGRHPGLDGDGQNLWAQPRDNTFTNQRRRPRTSACASIRRSTSRTISGS